MRIWKYRQSCLVVEAENGARIMLDAGFHTTGSRALRDLGPIDAVLYTHEHRDLSIRYGSDPFGNSACGSTLTARSVR
jgi:L-ascorbate metabolism protein UlaG (beta-lactamase superfamily)